VRERVISVRTALQCQNILKQEMLHEVNAHPIGQGIHFIVRDITADFKRKLAFNLRQIAYLPMLLTEQIAYLPMLLTVSCTRIPQTWTAIPIKTI
jgi:hypothetical protein